MLEPWHGFRLLLTAFFRVSLSDQAHIVVLDITFFQHIVMPYAWKEVRSVECT